MDAIILRNQLNGMGETLRQTQLMAELDPLLLIHSEQLRKIERLEALRDVLEDELARVTGRLSGFGFFKSRKTRNLEDRIGKMKVRIDNNEKTIATLETEIEKLQLQLELYGDSQSKALVTQTKTASGFSSGFAFNKTTAIIAVVLVGGGYLAYKKGWLEKLGIKLKD